MADAKKEDERPKERDDAGGEGGDEGDTTDSHLYEDWDDLATDPEEMSRVGRAIEGLLPDIVKRGVGGLVSEDGIRSLVKDRELPREAVGFILGQVDATKREVLRIVSKEVRLFLQNVDLGGELTKILTSVSFEIRTEVRFIPNDSNLKPNIRNRVSVRGKDGDEQMLSEEESGDFDDEQSRGSASGQSEVDSGEQEEGAEKSGDSQGGKRRRWSLRRRGAENNDDDEESGKDETPPA